MLYWVENVEKKTNLTPFHHSLLMRHKSREVMCLTVPIVIQTCQFVPKTDNTWNNWLQILQSFMSFVFLGVIFTFSICFMRIKDKEFVTLVAIRKSVSYILKMNLVGLTCSFS